jgi:hypothetical protein
MPSTIQNFFATIDPISPPSEMHRIGCIRGGGAGYCPRVCPQSVVNFSAIVLRPDDPICLMRPGLAQSVRDRLTSHPIFDPDTANFGRIK